MKKRCTLIKSVLTISSLLMSFGFSSFAQAVSFEEVQAQAERLEAKYKNTWEQHNEHRTLRVGLPFDVDGISNKALMNDILKNQQILNMHNSTYPNIELDCVHIVCAEK
ncbi:MAG: hypothetical protein KDD22_04960 [Bdellovibrionales bacterium]|nr:hypothetical protein [Bdellovibrionales bacterium]